MNTKVIEKYKNQITTICENVDSGCDIYICGSMVRGDYNEHSDLDVFTVSKTVEGTDILNKILFVGDDNLRISIIFFKKDRIPGLIKSPFGEYNLSIYNLKTGELIIGNDDDLFLEDREIWKKTRLNGVYLTKEEAIKFIQDSKG